MLQLTATRVLAVAVVFVALAGGVAAWAASTTDPAPPAATKDVPGLVSLARPTTPVALAGAPRAAIEMRIVEPGGAARAVATFGQMRTSTGRQVDRTCLAVGRKDELKATRRLVGNCLDNRGEQPWSIFTGASSEGPVTISGLTSDRVERLTLAGPGGTFTVPRSRNGAFVVVYGRRATGRAVLTATLADGTTRFFRTQVPPSSRPAGAAVAGDPDGAPPWYAAADVRRQGARAGQTCAQARQETNIRARDPRRQGGTLTAPVCGDLRRADVFARTVKTGRQDALGTFSRGRLDPRRTILVGAATADVRAVAVVGPDGRRELELAAAGRAFLAVYPEPVEPQQLTLEVTRQDGRVERFANPAAVNRATSEDPPPRLVGRPSLQLQPPSSRRVVLRMTLSGQAKRFEATFLGREVRMRPTGGTATRRSYVGVYDGTRGARRALRPGAVQRFTLVVCGDECATELQRARLTSGDPTAAVRRARTGQSAETQGRKIAFRAVTDTRADAVCRPSRAPAAFTDKAPLPEILAALPLVGTPPSPPPPRSQLAFNRLVLRSTVHRRRLPGNFVATTYVTDGSSPEDPQDRDGCRAARIERADQLLIGRPAAVREWALRRLDELRDVAPGLQTLWLFTSVPGRRGIGGGAGMPVRPGQPLRSGPSSAMTLGRRGTLYTGIAGESAVAVRVLSQHTRAPRQFRIVDRLYAIVLAPGSGRARLEELDTAGRVLRVRRLR